MKFHSSKVLLPQYVIFLEYTLASVEANKTVLKEEGAEDIISGGVSSSTFTFVRISVLVFLALVIAVLITACLVGLFKLCCLNSPVAGPNARNFPVQGAFRKVG